MALSANTVFEVRTTGSGTNSGGFITGSSGTDWSQQNSPQYAVTDGVTNGTTTVTSATAAFGVDVVGNLIYISGGTGSVTPQLYQIISRTNATTIVVDRSTGLTAGTGVTLNIGGAQNSCALGNFVVAGNIIYVKAGTYTITSASANVAGGTFSASVVVYIEGYQTTRGDMGTAPLFQASGAISSFTFFSATASRSTIKNIDVDGVSLATSRGFLIRGTGVKLKASNCTNSGFTPSTTGTFDRCVATGCSSISPFLASVTGVTFVDCIAYANTVTGFNITQANATCIRCLSFGNTGASSDGFFTNQIENNFINCLTYGNGRDGFRSSESTINFINCIAEANGAVGFNLANGNAVLMQNCAYYNNTGGNVTLGSGKMAINLNPVLGTGSFFTNAAGSDFSLNNTAGAGAAARAVGFPGTLVSGGTGYLDIGPLQHADPVTSSGPIIGAGLVF